MLGGMGKGALATCLKRKSRCLVADIVPGKTAASFNAAIENSLDDVPSELRQTLTLDNSSEITSFKKLEKANGLLRQYFSKGCNFRRITKEQMRKAVHRLNHRLRKC